LGCVSHLWFGFGKFPLKFAKNFPSDQKKYHLVGSKSTWIEGKLGSYLLWVKSMLGSGPISTTFQCQVMKPM